MLNLVGIFLKSKMTDSQGHFGAYLGEMLEKFSHLKMNMA
jgi:hypothetical protein